MVSMLSATVRISPGIHQRNPATVPFLRSVNVSLSLSTLLVASKVVVTQTLPTMGNFT